MPERPVTTSECALAIALPLSRDELHAELVSERPSDYVREIRARFPATSDDALSALYADKLGAAGQVIVEAAARGVTVVPRAGLADVAALTARCEVVSVLAHTPSPGIDAGDIQDVPAFLAALRAGRTPDQKRIRRFLRFGGIAVDPRGAPPDAGRVAARLEALLWTRGPPGARRFGQLDRTRVEDACPDTILPAPVIELADGLHPLARVRAAIAPGFQGVLDLSTCTSIVLAEALKRRRRDFLVVATDRPTRPALRLLRYRLYLRELTLAGGPVLFSRVVDAVAKALVLLARS
jgi:hypothetical protein